MLLTQQPRVRFTVYQNFFRGKIINVAVVNQRRWLEESGQWLENVYRTHLVLASGKPVLQKNMTGVVTEVHDVSLVDVDNELEGVAEDEDQDDADEHSGHGQVPVDKKWGSKSPEELFRGLIVNE